MKFLVVLTILLTIYRCGDCQQKSIPAQKSVIEIKGNENVVKVIQEDKIVVYNLNDKQKAEQFLAYLRTIPSLNSEIRKLLSNSEVSLQLLKNIYKDKAVNPQEFAKTIEKYTLENLQLRQENERLKNATTDPALAQVLEKANKELANYNNDGYQQVLNDFKRNSKKKYENEVAQVSYLQAINYVSNYRNNDALAQIDEALKYKSEDVMFLITKGHILLNLFSYTAAREIYLKILDLSKNDTLNVDTYNRIGLTYSGEGAYEKASAYYKKSIELDCKLNTQPQLPSPYNNIGNLYLNRGSGQKALEYLKVALALEMKMKLPDSTEVSNTYSNIGLCYHNMGDSALALKNFKLSLTWQPEKSNKINPHVAAIYNNIAIVYIAFQEFQKAADYLNPAIEINAKLGMGVSFLSASLFMNAGYISAGLGDQKTAEIDFKNCILTNKFIYGPLHPTVARAYYALGCFYYNIGDNSKAINYCDSTLEIQKQKFDELDQVLGDTYQTLGCAYFYVLGDTVSIGKSVPNFLEALKIRSNRTPLDEKEIASICYYLAMAFDNLRDNKNSLVYYNRASTIYEKLLGPKAKETKDANEYLGLNYVKIGDKTKGLSYLSRTDFETYPDSLKAQFLNEEAKVEGHRNYPLQTLNIQKLATEFVEKSPKKAGYAIDIYYQLGMSYFITHQKYKAMLELKKALSLAVMFKGDYSYIQDMITKCQDVYTQ